MTLVIAKEFRFEAWHMLPEHDGKCRNMHGHSYRVELGVSGIVIGKSGPKAGMLMDFSDLSAWWKAEVEALVDHNNDGLNGVMPDEFQPPTAENISRWIHSLLSRRLQGTLVYPAFVRVWETATSYAEYSTVA